MSFIVQLTDLEIIACRMIGNMRTILNRSTSVKDKQIGKQDIHETDENGTTGEYAFCKSKNILFDISLNPRSGSYDCIYKGKRIDIKTTKYKNGSLVATKKINPDIDVFVLAIFDQTKNEITFPGFALAEDLYQEKNITDLGHGTGYVMQQEDLRKWKET